MDARELFQSGRLDEAITAQTAEVKDHPTDPERRYLLCAPLRTIAFAIHTSGL